MLFEDILPALRAGKKVRCSSWEDDGSIGWWKWDGTRLFDHDGDFVDHPSQVSYIFSDDWEIIEEPKKIDLISGIYPEAPDGMMDLIHKINELIDRVNELEKKNEMD